MVFAVGDGEDHRVATRGWIAPHGALQRLVEGQAARSFQQAVGQRVGVGVGSGELVDEVHVGSDHRVGH